VTRSWKHLPCFPLRGANKCRSVKVGATKTPRNNTIPSRWAMPTMGKKRPSGGFLGAWDAVLGCPGAHSRIAAALAWHPVTSVMPRAHTCPRRNVHCSWPTASCSSELESRSIRAMSADACTQQPLPLLGPFHGKESIFTNRGVCRKG